jgi:Flp pilus assembly protein TadD
LFLIQETSPVFFPAVILMVSPSRLFRQLLLLGALFLFSLPSFGQNQLGSIIGEVHVTKGDFPAHPIMIELQSRGATVQTIYTDGQGRFGFSNLVSNPYHVIIKDDAFQPVDELANLNTIVSSIAMVQIRLVPMETTKKDTLGPRVAGSNPYLVDPEEYRKQFPKNAVKEYEKGLDAERQNKPDDAIKHYQKAVTLAPDFYPAHNNLGSAFLARADLPAAQSEFEIARKLNQNDAQACFNLGNVLMLTNQFPDAETNVKEGLKRRPDSAFGQFLLGSIYGRTGRTAEAERSLRAALQTDPTMSQAHLQLVNLYLQEKRTPEAEAELETYLKAFPDSPLAPKAREVLKRLQSQSASSAPQPQ